MEEAGLNGIGGAPAPMTPAEFGQRIAVDSERFGKLIRERSIKGD